MMLMISIFLCGKKIYAAEKTGNIILVKKVKILTGCHGDKVGNLYKEPGFFYEEDKWLENQIVKAQRVSPSSKRHLVV